jgi:signal peptidase I
VKRRSLGCLLELLETLLLALIVFIVVQMWVAQPYQVQQESMENTLMPDQFVLVDKLSPVFDDYNQGDIVVFTPPKGFSHDQVNTPFIKRVVGLPGDTVDIRDGKVYVNDLLLDEPYVFNHETTRVPDPKVHTWKVGRDQLFVMGDHRSASQDSRHFGPIDRSTVIGRAWLRYWPLKDFGLIKPVEKPTQPPAEPSATTSPGVSAGTTAEASAVSPSASASASPSK